MSATRPGTLGLVTNPALEDLEAGVREAYGSLLLFLADSELVIGHRHSEWTGFAPSAEEDVAFSSIAQDEMGHAHLYYSLIAGVESETAVDSLALDRGPRQMRHLPLLHAPNGDWFFTIARHIYWDLFEAAFLGLAVSSNLPLLSGAAQRVLNEEQYHLEHADQWLELLASRPKQRQRLARALDRVLAIGGNPFANVPGIDQLSGAGRFSGRRAGAAAYRELILPRVRNSLAAAEADAVERALDSAPVAADPPPGLYRLHRDLTGLRRAHAGASW